MASTHASSSGTIEQKVKASTAASYLVSLVVIALANGIQDHEGSLLLGSLPDWLESLLLPLLPAIATFLAGWAAKHTHRPDLPAANRIV